MINRGASIDGRTSMSQKVPVPHWHHLVSKLWIARPLSLLPDHDLVRCALIWTHTLKSAWWSNNFLCIKSATVLKLLIRLFHQFIVKITPKTIITCICCSNCSCCWKWISGKLTNFQCLMAKSLGSCTCNTLKIDVRLTTESQHQFQNQKKAAS